MEKRDLIIIGGGPAGMAAALSAKENGINDILIIERDEKFGGVLQQCIHNGFGLTRFKENLTGPEYAAIFEKKITEKNIEFMTETTVLDVKNDKTIKVINEEKGVFEIQAKAIILAMGCRERSKGALNIAGTRPSGIFSAGTAQRYVNIKGLSVGNNVVILGSGDIGLIMARRMTLEGAKVLAVVEIMPYSSGLKRNIAQCLDDFNIPLYLSHTITDIKGKERIESVTISEVDINKKPIKGTEFDIQCDTLLLSVGLIPENELTKKAGVELSPKTKGAIVDQTRETLQKGIFACGNVLQVHDLVDFVSEEAEIAGKYAAKYIENGERNKDYINIENNEKISYVLPQFIDLNLKEDFKLFFRVNGCYKNVIIELSKKATNEILYTKKKAIVTPGEMEHILISKALAEKLNGDIVLKVSEII